MVCEIESGTARHAASTCDTAVGEYPGTRKHSRCRADVRRAAGKTGSVVRREVARGNSGDDQPSQNYRDGDRSAEPSEPHLLSVRLFAAHAPSSEQALVEDRTTSAGPCLLPSL